MPWAGRIGVYARSSCILADIDGGNVRIGRSVRNWVPRSAALLRSTGHDLSTDEGRSRERYRRAALGTGGAIGARAISALASLITVPLTLSYLGVERYGMWMTISSLALLLIFSDLGLGNGMLSAISIAHGRGDRTTTARIIASGVWMLVAIGSLLAIALLLSYPFVGWADLLNVSGPLARAEAPQAMLVFGLLFAASLPLAAVVQVRQAHQEAYVNSAYMAAGSVIGLIAAVAAIMAHAALPILVFALMGGPMLATGVNALVLFGRQRPELRPVLRNVEAGMAIRLLRSGWQFLVLQLAMAAAFYSDTLVAALVIGPEAVADYSVVSKLFLIPTVVASAVLSPLWAAYGDAAGRGDVAWLQKTLRRSILAMLVITVPMAVGLTLLAPAIIEVWVGAAISPPMLLVIGMAIWTVLGAVGSSLAIPLNALHRLRVQIVTAVAMGVLNVTLSIYFASRIGVSGVILGTVIAYPIATLIPLAMYVPRVLERMAAGATRLDPGPGG